MKVYQEVADIGKKDGFDVIVQAGEQFLTNFQKNRKWRSIGHCHPWLQDRCTILDGGKMLVQDLSQQSREIKQALWCIC